MEYEIEGVFRGRGPGLLRLHKAVEFLREVRCGRDVEVWWYVGSEGKGIWCESRSFFLLKRIEGVPRQRELTTSLPTQPLEGINKPSR